MFELKNLTQETRENLKFGLIDRKIAGLNAIKENIGLIILIRVLNKQITQ